MRIGVNALYLIPGGVGGTEIYLRNLLGALAELDAGNEYHVFTNRETGRDLVPERPNFFHVPLAVRAACRPARILWEQTALPLAVGRLRLDALFNPGFTAPALCSCPQATLFHDLQHHLHPEYFRWFDLPFWRLFLWISTRVSRTLLVTTELNRDDLLRAYPLDPARVRVAPLGVEPRFFALARERSPRPYLLCASTLHPHKNIPGLLRAFSEWRRRRPGFELVVTGVRGFETEAVERLVRELHLESAVRLTGWIPREELYTLFRDAWAFVYPTEFEGFGMPVLEALAAGVPTACSAIEPLLTLAGGAALHFDPRDPHSIVEALDRVACDEALRARLAAEGPARAARFSWRTTAELTLDAIRAATER